MLHMLQLALLKAKMIVIPTFITIFKPMHELLKAVKGSAYKHTTIVLAISKKLMVLPSYNSLHRRHANIAVQDCFIVNHVTFAA